MKIDRIDVIPVEYPVRGSFKFFKTAGYRVLLVKITADNGMVGWGQSLPVPTWSYETPETAAIILREYYAPALLGHDPLDIEGAHAILDRALAASFSIGMPLTRAGLDLALHDLAGKFCGKSLPELWAEKGDSPHLCEAPSGPFRQMGTVPFFRPITLSWTINVRSLDALDAEIEAAARRGYHNFNIKVAPDPRFDVELARAVRRAAPNGFLWADANCGYDLATALEVAPKLADAGVEILEAPLRPNRIGGYQALKRQGALPITMDEGVVSVVEVEEFIRLGMFDGLTIKHARCGGLLAARKQIETVLDAGLFILGSGLTDPDVSLAAALALFSSYGLARPAALNGPQFLTDTVLREPLSIQGDQAAPNTGPGLGIEVDEEKVRALMVK